jgi:hypothetical protein
MRESHVSDTKLTGKSLLGGRKNRLQRKETLAKSIRKKEGNQATILDRKIPTKRNLWVANTLLRRP